MLRWGRVLFVTGLLVGCSESGPSAYEEPAIQGNDDNDGDDAGTRVPLPPSERKDAGVEAADASPSPVDAGKGDQEAPPKPEATVTVDGVPLTVQSITLWTDVTPGDYDLFIKVTGTGAPPGSDVFVKGRATGSGCDITKNFIFYRPLQAAQHYPGLRSPNCGLTISALPKAVGGHYTGTFKGTLPNEDNAKALKSFDITFDVVRKK